ncbi:PDR/VanB family oxidoreductase [Telluria aromaticivorans]|uniref:Oxidoreductase n=1 Tax=Telluria aromaticivorans TaxID=2725995 RepID=A0A7Y2NYL1_9BURK|nr:PDR/VanB family oxidoreductase [Telluria aromaticivorans]NNG21611.1 oxidoreductase [Telluria aromaticivorans]
MRYLIQTVVQHGPHVKEFRMVPADGSTAPGWAPGSHVDIGFRSHSGEEFHKAYSLVGAPGECLRIAVQREPAGRGGSRVLHDEYRPGMEVELGAPVDAFELKRGAVRTVLVAGGIGITPMTSMAQALDGDGHRFELHYLAREAERLVLMDEFDGMRHGVVSTYLTSSGQRPDLDALIGPYAQGSELHACGPVSLLEAIRTRAAALGWPAAHVHVESFGARTASEDKPVRVYLRQSDLRIEVAPGTSILDAMIAADAFVSYDCKRGECGNCFAQVVSGTPVHRDVCLTPEQRLQGMTTCVSWAAGGDLELDL